MEIKKNIRKFVDSPKTKKAVKVSKDTVRFVRAQTIIAGKVVKYATQQAILLEKQESDRRLERKLLQSN